MNLGESRRNVEIGDVQGAFDPKDMMDILLVYLGDFGEDIAGFDNGLLENLQEYVDGNISYLFDGSTENDNA